MRSWTPYVIAACVAVYLLSSIVSQEYSAIRSAIGETKSKTDAVADETKATMEAIKQTIEDLRGKFMTLEMQLSGNAGELKPIDDVGETDQPKQTKPVIVMHSASWCGPCQSWKRDAMPKWTAIGWDVSVVEDDSTSQTVPWFEITDSDGKEFTVTGYLTKAAFDAAKAKK